VDNFKGAVTCYDKNMLLGLKDSFRKLRKKSENQYLIIFVMALFVLAFSLKHVTAP